MNEPGMMYPASELGLWEYGFVTCALLLGMCLFGIASAGIEWALRRWGK